MAKKKEKKIRPIGDKILVKRMVAEEKTQVGIIIPDSSQEKPLEGEVVSVGNGRSDNKGNVTPLTLKKGDKVIAYIILPLLIPPKINIFSGLL